MSVDLERAVAGEWDGRVFHFCSRGCKAEFMVDPPSFVAPEGEAGPAPTR
jgi:YHS domain-containing protein